MSEPLAYETEFVEHELLQWASHVDTKLKAALSANEVGVTEALRSSIAFRVMQGGGANKGSYQLIFNEYGRMVDMGSGRGIKGLQTDQAKSAAVGRMNSSPRKPRKWYSKTFYSSLNGLVAALSRNYTAYAAKRATDKAQTT